MTNTIEVDPSHRHQLMQVWFRTVLILALGFSGSFLTANAQVTTTINGPVTDASGGVVPKARVTLTNDATKEKRVVPSNGSGFFSYSVIESGLVQRPHRSPGIQCAGTTWDPTQCRRQQKTFQEWSLLSEAHNKPSRSVRAARLFQLRAVNVLPCLNQRRSNAIPMGLSRRGAATTTEHPACKGCTAFACIRTGLW